MLGVKAATVAASGIESKHLYRLSPLVDGGGGGD